jgi:hypothetical protein
MAYRVSHERWDAVLEGLDARESGGFERQDLALELRDATRDLRAGLRCHRQQSELPGTCECRGDRCAGAALPRKERQQPRVRRAPARGPSKHWGCPIPTSRRPRGAYRTDPARPRRHAKAGITFSVNRRAGSRVSRPKNSSPKSGG